MSANCGLCYAHVTYHVFLAHGPGNVPLTDDVNSWSPPAPPRRRARERRHALVRSTAIREADVCGLDAAGRPRCSIHSLDSRRRTRKCCLCELLLKWAIEMLPIKSAKSETTLAAK
jgi:hypothetical protein